MMGYAVIAVGGSLLGYLIGTRKARAMKKRVIQQLNSQSLDLLDAKALKNEFDEYVVEQEAKNKTLQVCMARLSQANQRVSTLETLLTDQARKHFVEQSTTRARAVDAVNIARRATAVAQDAALRLKQLEHKPSVGEEVKASEPRQRVGAGAIAVSVVDKVSPDDVVTTMAPASSRESSRRSKIGNSKEASMS